MLLPITGKCKRCMMPEGRFLMTWFIMVFYESIEVVSRCLPPVLGRVSQLIIRLSGEESEMDLGQP